MQGNTSYSNKTWTLIPAVTAAGQAVLTCNRDMWAQEKAIGDWSKVTEFHREKNPDSPEHTCLGYLQSVSVLQGRTFVFTPLHIYTPRGGLTGTLATLENATHTLWLFSLKGHGADGCYSFRSCGRDCRQTSLAFCLTGKTKF